MLDKSVPFYDKPDTKFVGFLNYRVLRIIAWVSMALGMIVTMQSLLSLEDVHPYSFFDGVWKNIFDAVGSISMPLFVLSAFGLVVSRKRSFKSELLLFGLGSLGIFLAALFIELRYVYSLLNIGAGIPTQEINNFLLTKFAKPLQFNVFLDLFLTTLFSFFIEYNPKRFFKGKKLKYFRMFAAFPVIYVLASFFLSIFIRHGDLKIPVVLLPLLSTKHPLIVFVFFASVLFLKYRSDYMKKIGKSHEEIKRYENSNNRAHSFSLFVAIGYGIIAVFDFIVLFAIGIFTINDPDSFIFISTSFRVGESMSALLAIPFVVLYSYKKEVKDPSKDLVINFIGVGLVAFVIIEGLYEFVINLMASVE